MFKKKEELSDLTLVRIARIGHHKRPDQHILNYLPLTDAIIQMVYDGSSLEEIASLASTTKKTLLSVIGESIRPSFPLIASLCHTVGISVDECFNWNAEWESLSLQSEFRETMKL